MKNAPVLPERIGPRPRTTMVPPHRQVEQFPTPPIVGELLRYCFAMPNVVPRPSAAGFNCTYALWLPPRLARGPDRAFLAPGEFANLHPLPEGGLHLTLPERQRRAAESHGWVESHPMTKSSALPNTTVLIYAPRNARELEVVYGLLLESYRFARGDDPAFY